LQLVILPLIFILSLLQEVNSKAIIKPGTIHFIV
jgi:hypothetical protein